MKLKSKFKVENTAVLLFSIFYAVAGVAEVFVMVSSILNATRTLIHVGILGFLSLITSYGLLRTRRWSVLLVVALFFLGVTFSAITLYNSVMLQTFEGALLFHVALIAYLILTLVASMYVVTRREDFQ